MAKTSATLEQPKESNDFFPAEQPDAAEDSLKLFAVVDKCLLAAVREGRVTLQQMTGGEFLLCRRMGWDKEQSRRELSIREQIVLNQTKAGTLKERQAAQQRLDAANERLATEGGELRAELQRITDEMNAKIAKLESQAAEAQAVVFRHSQATLKLRNNAPEHIKHDSRNVVRRAADAYKERLSELALMISRAEGIAKIEPGNLGEMENAVRYAEAHQPDLLLPVDPRARPKQRQVNIPKWHEHVREMQAKLPSLRNEYRALKANEAEAVRKAEEETLSYYVPN